MQNKLNISMYYLGSVSEPRDIFVLHGDAQLDVHYLLIFSF